MLPDDNWSSFTLSGAYLDHVFQELGEVGRVVDKDVYEFLCVGFVWLRTAHQILCQQETNESCTDHNVQDVSMQRQ